MPSFFRNVNIAPHGGFFYETHGEKVAAPTYVEIEPKVRALMRKYHIPGTVEEAVAGYMCPRIPEGARLCTGSFAPARDMIPAREAMANSEAYAGRHVVTFDELSRRLRVCMACPKHTREFCVTCTGHMNRILLLFNGRRVSVPEDRGSGICRCARAYEAAIASVDYGRDEKPWAGAPDTCWRNGG